MSTVLLVRHGLTAMTGPVLAGHTPGVHLDERGRTQAAAVAQRLAVLPLTAIVTSPLERCVETAQAVRDAQTGAGEWAVDDRLVEARYGDWTGRKISELTREPMWKVVQAQPSAAVFPGGEAMRDTQHRAVAAMRDWDARLGEDALWMACSHGDVIKSILADALGIHLDQFQRIVVDPCSVSVVRYTASRPFVMHTNDTGSDLSGLKPPKRRGRRKKSDDATIGGGAGGGQL